jgi:hypothetical protein
MLNLPLPPPRWETGRINAQSLILLNRPALYYTPDYTFTVLDTAAHEVVQSTQTLPRLWYSWFVKSILKADGSDFIDDKSQLRNDFPEYFRGFTLRKRVTFSFYLIKQHFMKTYEGVDIVDLGTRCRWVVSFTPRPLGPSRNSPWYPLGRRLGWPQSRSRRYEGEKAFGPCRESNTAAQPVTHRWNIPALYSLSGDMEKPLMSHFFESGIQNHIIRLYVTWAAVYSAKKNRKQKLHTQPYSLSSFLRLLVINWTIFS